jgi:hypothetical protein
MLGLKGSGKTTYLAALWHFLESAEIGDDIVLPRLQPYRDYLNSIRSTWLSLERVGRTSMRSFNTATLSLQQRETGATFDVVLPDLSGESFKQQWATRRASTSYHDFASACNGVLLFVHPSSYRKTHPIKPREADSSEDEDEGGARTIPVSETWTPEQSSTQVQLVDLLQILFSLRSQVTGLRVAVVISAWDLVNPALTPTGWLERRLPLLAQFLRANGDWMSSEVFGVSAQGGDLSADHQRLLDVEVPSKRCKTIRGNDPSPVSLTAPLRFLLNI